MNKYSKVLLCLVFAGGLLAASIILTQKPSQNTASLSDTTSGIAYLFEELKWEDPALPVRSPSTSKSSLSIERSARLTQSKQIQLERLRVGDTLALFKYDGKPVVGKIQVFEEVPSLNMKRVAGQLQGAGSFSLTLDQSLQVTAGLLVNFENEHSFVIQKETGGLYVHQKPTSSVVGE